jgi:hypothetical protein
MSAAPDCAPSARRWQSQTAHLLLAFSRGRQVRDLLGERSITVRELHAAIVRVDGIGDELVLGRLPRSRAAEEVLQRAVVVTTERGERRRTLCTYSWRWPMMVAFRRSCTTLL